jgi:small subunit ribosomal protein S1
MAGHHVDLPEQVVTPGEELWVKIIDIDLQRRRISLSIKQAAEGGEVSEEYREAFGEHAYDDEGNYVGPVFAEAEFTPETEAQAAWADYVAEHGTSEGAPEVTDAAAVPAEAAAVPAEGVGVPVDAEPAPAPEAVAVAEAAPVVAEPAVAAPAAEPAAPVEATEPGATE